MSRARFVDVASVADVARGSCFQSVVALSTRKAECIVLRDATQEVKKKLIWIQHPLARGYRAPSEVVLWAQLMRRGLVASEAFCRQDPPIPSSVLIANQHLLSKTVSTPGVEPGTCGTVIHPSTRTERQPPQEVMFFRHSLTELLMVLKRPTSIMENNKICISYANNSIKTSNSKHINIYLHFGRDASRDKCIIMQ
jgi:hypothetical protein